MSSHETYLNGQAVFEVEDSYGRPFMDLVHAQGNGAGQNHDIFHTASLSAYPMGGVQGDAFSLSLSRGAEQEAARPDLNVAEVYQEVIPAVVSIPRPQSTRESAHAESLHAPRLETMGSGFVIDAQEGIVVTNWHVAEKAGDLSVNVCGQNIQAAIIGVDPYSDLAFLKLKTLPENLKALTLGDTTDLKVGDQVMTIGSPFGLDGSVGTGIISGPPRKLPSESGFPMSGLIQHSAMINPGNSGGVLIDARGHVIGMNTAIPTTSGGFQGIGLAVAAQEIAEAWDELKSTGVITQQYTGMRFAKTDFGVALASVDPDSPAARLGITAEKPIKRRLFSRKSEVDIEKCTYLTHINRKPIVSPDDVAAALEANDGSAVEFTLKRTASGSPYTVSIIPDKHPVADMVKLNEVRSRLSSPGDGCSHLYLGQAARALKPDELQVLLAAYNMVAIVDKKGITVHINPSEAAAALLGNKKNLDWLTGELAAIGFTVDPKDDLTFWHRADPYRAEEIISSLGRIAHGVSEDEISKRMKGLPPELLDALRKKLGPGLGGGMIVID